MVNLPGGGSRFRHNARKLLDCIRLSSYLTGGPSALADAVAGALAAVLPDFLKAPFMKFLKKSGHHLGILPSANMAHRYELSLDVAMLQLAQGHIAQDCIRVGWTDSSPIAGYDWVWSQYHEIPVSKLVQCFDAVCRLQRAISAMVAELIRRSEIAPGDEDADLDLPTEPLPSWRPWLDIPSLSVREQIHPPAALSGHRSLADKAASEIFKWHLQRPQAVSLESHAASYIAHCSDTGVELSLPDFQLQGCLDTLLPSWLREQLHMQPDLEKEAPCAVPSSQGLRDVDDVDGPVLDDDSPVNPAHAHGQDREMVAPLAAAPNAQEPSETRFSCLKL